MPASNTPNATSVCWARLTMGVRNWGTALAIASTPVSEEQPAANSLRINTTPSASVARMGPRSAPITASGCGRMNPTMMMAKILTTNTIVGPISTLADSAIPIRLMAVIRASPANVTPSK
jgi:hypothetical protein